MGRQPIVIERVIAAAPEAVFAAWGDAASLRAWMVPGPTMHGAKRRGRLPGRRQLPHRHARSRSRLRPPRRVPRHRADPPQPPALW